MNAKVYISSYKTGANVPRSCVIDHYDTKSKFSSAYDVSPNACPSPFPGNGNGRVLIQSFSSPSTNNGNGNTIQLIPSTSLASSIEWYDDSQQNNVNNSVTLIIYKQVE